MRLEALVTASLENAPYVAVGENDAPQGQSALDANGFQSFAAVRVTLSTGEWIGSLAAFYDAATATDDRDGAALAELAALVAVEVERQMQRDATVAREKTARLASDAFSESLFEASTDCLKTLDLSGHLQGMNQNGCVLMEVDDLPAIVGAYWPDFWPGEGRALAEAAVATAREGTEASFSAFCPTTKGTPKWWSVRVVPVRSATGTVERLLSSSRDITADLEAREALQRSHVELAATFASAPVGLAVHDRELRFVRVNSRMAEINGMPAEAHAGKTLREVVGDEIAAAVEPRLRRVLDEGEAVLNVEVTGHTASHPGEERTWLVNWVPVRVGSDVVGVNVATQDITELKETQAALREQESRYRLIADATFDAVWDWDLTQDRISWNSSVADHFGWAEAVAGTSGAWWKERVHPDDRVRVVASITEVINGTGEHWEAEYRFRRADDTYAEVFDRGRVLKDEEGRVSRMIGAMLDFSQIRGVEANLRASEGRFRALVEASSQIVWATDPDGSVVEDSPSWRAFTGQSFEDWIGYGWVQVLHPDDRLKAETAWRKAVEARSAYTVEYRIRRADGEYRWTLARGVPVFAPDGAIREWVGMNVDVTEQKASEAALRASEELFRLALDAADVAALTWDLGTDGISGDSRFYDVMGIPRGDEITAADTLAHRVHPDDLPCVQAQIEDGLRNGRYTVDCRILAPPSGYPDGRSVRWTTFNGLVRYEGAKEERRPVRVVGTLRDITELREAEVELKALNEDLETRVNMRTAELAEANRTLEIRNRELQDFAYVASHDLQEPLRKIRSYAQLLAHEHGKGLDEEGRHFVERMHASAERMSNLIRDLLAFSRVTTREQPLQDVDLNQTLNAVRVDLDLRLEETGGRVDVGVLPHVQADPLQMHQLLLNLIGNGLKFHRKGVPPVVRVSGEEEGRYVRIIVEDNGIGFEPKYAGRIFAPFQRLHAKHEYEGTGMGLAIVRRIAERHHGTATATSMLGNGSRFEVVIPGQVRGGPSAAS